MKGITAIIAIVISIITKGLLIFCAQNWFLIEVFNIEPINFKQCVLLGLTIMMVCNNNAEKINTDTFYREVIIKLINPYILLLIMYIIKLIIL